MTDGRDMITKNFTRADIREMERVVKLQKGLLRTAFKYSPLGLLSGALKSGVKNVKDIASGKTKDEDNEGLSTKLKYGGAIGLGALGIKAGVKGLAALKRKIKEMLSRRKGSCPTPGMKIRSKGKGRGMGVGRGRGPIGRMAD